MLRRRGRSRSNRRSAEAGQATIDLVIAFSTLWLLVATIIQFGLWAHASNVVAAAAQEGARTARSETGSEAAGRARAEMLLQGAGGQHLFSEWKIETHRDRDTARVDIRAKAVGMVPGLQLPVHAASAGPVERFRRSSS